MDQSVKMRLTIGGKVFIANMLDIPPVRGIIAQCPFKLSFSRSAEHEYYARLPVKVDIQGCKGVSNIQANKLYLFAAWNAFSLNFLEMNISPYEVIELGSFDEDLVPLLQQSGNQINILCELA